ncbi:hypothetical protein RJT34_25409 [Clitoria ternatea]|uniref:Uncharacterized protein n=1 Tax=Clitoria ternatea TaxID=43366 RepID=A0AAN9ILF4_CLITE
MINLATVSHWFNAQVKNKNMLDYIRIPRNPHLASSQPECGVERNAKPKQSPSLFLQNLGASSMRALMFGSVEG